MKVDRRLEVARVPEAARLPFDRHDLTVESFGGAIGDGMLTVAQDTGTGDSIPTAQGGRAGWWTRRVGR